MSAEDIAKVVQDLRTGRFDMADPRGIRAAGFFPALHPDVDPVVLLAKREAHVATVVDATDIYRSLRDQNRTLRLYEDHLLAPPWDHAIVTYVNEYGNVIPMVSVALDFKDQGVPLYEQWEVNIPAHGALVEDLEQAVLAGVSLPGNMIIVDQAKTPDHTVDWEQVRWTLNVFIFAGGSTHGRAVVTRGPLLVWRIAILPDGTPADIRWEQIEPEIPLQNWDMALVVFLQTFNFMNCRNVEIVEPRRPRPERRRLMRMGAPPIHVLNVFPVGKSTRGGRRGSEDSRGVPLTTVRGTFHHYGPEYGKGLLFGKIAGRFWVPQHARGNKFLGETEHEYRLRPGVDSPPAPVVK